MRIPEDNDPMNMVGHHHERVQPDARVMVRQPQPTAAHHPRLRFSTTRSPATRPKRGSRCAVQMVRKYAPDDA